MDKPTSTRCSSLATQSRFAQNWAGFRHEPCHCHFEAPTESSKVLARSTLLGSHLPPDESTQVSGVSLGFAWVIRPRTGGSTFRGHRIRDRSPSQTPRVRARLSLGNFALPMGLRGVGSLDCYSLLCLFNHRSFEKPQSMSLPSWVLVILAFRFGVRGARA